MAQVSSGRSDAAAVPADDLDDLFNYDVNMDVVLRDVDPNMDAPVTPKLPAKTSGKENAVGLGIDEEIKVVKQRRPIPKLDEPRCVTAAPTDCSKDCHLSVQQTSIPSGDSKAKATC